MISVNIIERFLDDYKDEGTYWVDLQSKLIHDRIMYRADLGYEVTGKWSDTIEESFNTLVVEMRRLGLI